MLKEYRIAWINELGFYNVVEFDTFNDANTAFYILADGSQNIMVAMMRKRHEGTWINEKVTYKQMH